MATIHEKYARLIQMVVSFEQALLQHHRWVEDLDVKAVEALGIDLQNIILILRDSSLRHFKLSVDLFWKYIKTYLEEKLQIVPEILSPKTIIRHACQAKLISEAEAEAVLDMIKKRNLTSHIYQEELAAELIGDLSSYLTVMNEILERIVP